MISNIVLLMGQAVWYLLAVAVVLVFYSLVTNPRRRHPQRADAEHRAEMLLQSQLSPEEYHQLVTQGYLRVQSPSTPHRTYLIPRYRGLVRVYEQGRSVMRLCVGPVEPVPDADVVLMHKLMIEGNEREYLESANVF